LEAVRRGDPRACGNNQVDALAKAAAQELDSWLLLMHLKMTLPTRVRGRDLEWEYLGVPLCKTGTCLSSIFTKANESVEAIANFVVWFLHFLDFDIVVLLSLPVHLFYKLRV